MPHWVQVAGSIVLVAITIAILYSTYRKGRWQLPRDRPMVLLVLFALWAVVPPLGFMLEASFLSPALDDTIGFERFKHNQELSKNLWLGFSLALGLLVGIKPQA